MDAQRQQDTAGGEEEGEASGLRLGLLDGFVRHLALEADGVLSDRCCWLLRLAEDGRQTSSSSSPSIDGIKFYSPISCLL